jgi:regulator of sigma E protease
MLLSIVAAVAVLALLIIVHETGHFLVAKRAGVRVLRFSLGYPPKLFAVRWGETEYALSATPFGGYVRMLGDEVAEELGTSDVKAYLREVGRDLLNRSVQTTSQGQFGAARTEGGEDEKLLGLARRLAAQIDQSNDTNLIAREIGRELRPEERLLIEEVARQQSVEKAFDALSKAPPAVLAKALRRQAFPTQPLGKRTAIVLAGPLANILFVPVILTAVFVYGVPTLLPVIGQVKPNLPAQRAGLRAGDRIVAIDQRPVASWEELSNLIKTSQGRALRIEFERQEQGVRKSLATVIRAQREVEGPSGAGIGPQWVIGVMPRGDVSIERFGPISAVIRALSETAKMTVALVSGLARIFVGATPLRETLGGPIMIARLAGEQAHQGVANLGLFMAMLSLELGIINLFPVPMLDGGHLLFFAIEGVRGRPLQVRHRELAQQAGLVLLAALMAFVIFNDITRLAQG